MDKKENKRDNKKTRILKKGVLGRQKGKTPEIAGNMLFQGRCCFGGILNHTNRNQQEQNPKNQTKASVGRAAAATTTIARTTTTINNNNQR